MSIAAQAFDIFESAVTIRQQEVSLSSSVSIVESHAGPSKRRRVVSIKARETLEIRPEIESARANKVPSALREWTNRLSENEGYTGPKNVVTLPSSSARTMPMGTWLVGIECSIRIERVHSIIVSWDCGSDAHSCDGFTRRG